jgi:hypothetical protein
MRISCKRTTRKEEEGKYPRRRGCGRKTPVEQWKDGKLIDTFPTMAAASLAVGHNRNYLSSMFNDRGSDNSVTVIVASGYTWKRKPAVMNGKFVLQYDQNGKFIAEHKSAKAAAKKLGISVDVVRRNCQGRTRLTAGYMFEYKEEPGRIRYTPTCLGKNEAKHSAEDMAIDGEK